MTELSPAARAILEAATNTPYDMPYEHDLAAAFRAVAKHCVPDDSEGHWVYIPHVLAIAHELEAL